MRRLSAAMTPPGELVPALHEALFCVLSRFTVRLEALTLAAWNSRQNAKKPPARQGTTSDTNMHPRQCRNPLKTQYSLAKRDDMRDDTNPHFLALFFTISDIYG